MENKKRNPFQVIFHYVSTRVWFIVSCVLVALLIAVTIIVRGPLLSGVMNQLFGGDRAVAKGGGTAVTYELDDDVKAGDKTTSLAHGNAVNNEICNEGFILLKNKNDNALPVTNAKGKKVSVFGHNSINMPTAGSGSAGNAADGSTKTIFDSLTEVGFEVNTTLKDFYSSDKAGDARSSNPGMDAGGAATLKTGETPVANYTEDVKKSFSTYNDVAVVVITRIAGEGFDLPRIQDGDDTKTFLDLDKNELDMIDMVTNAGFGKVVVVLNAANQVNCTPLEDNDKVDAILWTGFAGAQGIMAAGRIISGDVNPSGHLTDTYVKDFASNPSFVNFGDNNYPGHVVENGDAFVMDVNGTLRKAGQYFVDYEESIYVGYRYYETRYTTESDGDNWYSKNVLYPFGYGKSYSTFEWTVKNGSALSTAGLTKDKFTVEVEVKNNSETPGKDVVQVYAEAPYTKNGIEKSAKVLVGFAKTSLLAKNASETVKIEIDPYNFASYDYNDANKNDFKGYELEKGNYNFYVATTAHDSSRKISMDLAEGIKYDVDPVTGTKVENHFTTDDNESIDCHLGSKLSRADFAGTYPASPTDADRTIEKGGDLYNKLKEFDWYDPANPLVSNPSSVSMPKNGVIPTDSEGNAAPMKLVELKGKDFNDPLWETLLDQANLDEEFTMLNEGGFNTAKMDSITKPKTTDADGPVGLTCFMGDPTVNNTVQYACEVVSASTWNVDLLEKLGESVGDEGLVGYSNGDGMPYTGWYAPAMNLHRSPFGGRCAEYYSEDPFLSGKMGAAEVKGANVKGMTTYLKHFVGNEGETHRDSYGDSSFMTEQALRELYLRPFEITVKEGKARGIMSSFNRLGVRWTGANYSLFTTVLRNEWGFHGAVVSDFNTHWKKSDYMHTGPMMYAGGTLNLVSQADTTGFFDKTKAADVQALRICTHETLYAVVNSNVMTKEVDHYEPAYWKIILTTVDIVIPCCLVIWGGFVIFFAYKKEKQQN